MSGYACQVFETKSDICLKKRTVFVIKLYKNCSHQHFIKCQYKKREKKRVLFNLYPFQSEKKHVNLAPF